MMTCSTGTAWDTMTASKLNYILHVSYITANIYCKSRNLPNASVHNYSIDLR